LPATVVPVPETDCTTVPLVALLRKLTVPETVPAVCGAKVTSKETLVPEAIVSGKEMLLTEKAAWLTPAEEIVTGPFVALRVAAWLWFAPTTTFPKVRVEGVTANWPGDVVLPDSGIESVELAASEVMTRLPVELPPVCGANTALNVVL
jgi:hypothetical protein